MKILLTGSTGQVGHELLRTLAGCGDVIAVDRATMDLSDLQQVRETVRAIRPQLIVNPAAYTAVDRAESERALAMRINRDAPAVLAEEAARLGAALIHYSTDYVFDGTKEGAYVEDDPVCPINVYGESKLAGEQAIQAAGIAHLIFRTQWVYGKHGKNFLLTMLRLAQEKEQLSVVDDQIGAPTWARSIAEATAGVVGRVALLPVAEQAAWWQQHSGIYHLTAQGSTSWHGFAQAIFSRNQARNGGKQPLVNGIPSAAYPTPARRPHNSRLCCDKFTDRFFALPHWEQALDRCFAEEA